MLAHWGLPSFAAFGNLQLLTCKEAYVVTLINSPTKYHTCEANLTILSAEFTLHLESKTWHTSFIS